MEEVLEHSDRPVNLIIAFRGYKSELLAGYEDKINEVVDMDFTAGLYYGEEDNVIQYEWVNQNESALQDLFAMLEDTLSKNTLLAYLNQKISWDYKYLDKVMQPFQYFDEEINKMSEHEIFVDCGAYDGDSAVDFISALRRRGIDTYDEIISFEPNPDNYSKLRERNLRNHTCIMKGVSNEKKRVFFSSEDTSSRCREDGDMCVEVDSIDHVMKGRRVTMIKMDIEGAELDALYGAKYTIKKYRPLLAICVYHKREDLLTIPQYIKSLVPEYKLFLRAYERTATEIVLYAVC